MACLVNKGGLHIGHSFSELVGLVDRLEILVTVEDEEELARTGLSPQKLASGCRQKVFVLRRTGHRLSSANAFW